jgi:hypothetical protein
MERMPCGWHPPARGTDFSKPGLRGALTCPNGLLDFEVSPVVALCGHRGMFFDNSAVDLFRFRPARDRVTGTDWMVVKLLRECGGSLVGN